MRLLATGLCTLLTISSLSLATAAPKQSKKMSDASTQVKFETTLGNFTVKLNKEKAPVTVENFISYVKDGHYDGTTFHRVIPGFMAQGGGYTVEFKQKTTKAPIKIEANNGLKNNRGTIAMARTSDPNSATSQFFINYKNNDFLNHSSPTPQGWGYTVFGEVVDGMDVIDEMAKVPTGAGGPMPSDVPKTPIVINKASIVGQ